MTALQKRTSRTRPAIIPEKAVLQRPVKTQALRSRLHPGRDVATGHSSFPGSPADVIESMRSGINAQVVPALAKRLQISQDRLFDALRLPKSTIKARISGNKPLSSTEQDRIYRVEKSLTRALVVFEVEEGARTWMTSKIETLGDVTPLSLLDTEAGYELVLDTLGRIEYGVYA